MIDFQESPESPLTPTQLVVDAKVTVNRIQQVASQYPITVDALMNHSELGSTDSTPVVTARQLIANLDSLEPAVLATERIAASVFDRKKGEDPFLVDKAIKDFGTMVSTQKDPDELLETVKDELNKVTNKMMGDVGIKRQIHEPLATAIQHLEDFKDPPVRDNLSHYKRLHEAITELTSK